MPFQCPHEDEQAGWVEASRPGRFVSRATCGRNECVNTLIAEVGAEVGAQARFRPYQVGRRSRRGGRR